MHKDLSGVATPGQVVEGVFEPQLKATLPTTYDFYNQFSTRILKAVETGFERDFDTVSTDPHEGRYLPSAEYLLRQLNAIRQVLEQRAQEQANRSVTIGNAYDEVKNGRVTAITRWHRKGGKQ